nr:DNA-processing protein DprA [Kibdelosporangium phytohabitans]
MLALRTSELAWPVIARRVEESGSALRILDDLTAPSTPTLDHRPLDLDSAIAAVQDEIEQWSAEGVSLATLLDESYPTQLLMVHQRPPFLTFRGLPDPSETNAVAVVGSRAASPAGLERARDVATLLANHGTTVVSGLAAGIDTAVHRATLDAGSRTVAVVGVGLRHCYPAENRELQEQIARTGVVISQFWPDAGPAKHQFPMRNAVMSGLSVATVVVEAGEHSGARTQARLALEHGRHVFLMRETLVNEWARAIADRPNTTVLEGPDHLIKVLDDLLAEVPDLIAG